MNKREARRHAAKAMYEIIARVGGGYVSDLWEGISLDRKDIEKMNEAYWDLRMEFYYRYNIQGLLKGK